MTDTREVPVFGGPHDGFGVTLALLEKDKWPRSLILDWEADNGLWDCLHEFNEVAGAYVFLHMTKKNPEEG